MKRKNNRKGKFGIYYHIFADNIDYFEVTLKKANEIFNKLCKEGWENIRLYQVWYSTKEEAKSCDSVPENRNVLRLRGNYPH